MAGSSVRRLAALDLVGVSGRVGRRAQIIVVEFLASAVIGVGLGTWLWVAGALMLGVALLGVGLNYVPLAAHAINFLRHPDALSAELDHVDIRPELRGYGGKQFLLIVPFLVAGAALVQHYTRRSH